MIERQSNARQLWKLQFWWLFLLRCRKGENEGVSHGDHLCFKGKCSSTLSTTPIQQFKSHSSFYNPSFNVIQIKWNNFPKKFGQLIIVLDYARANLTARAHARVHAYEDKRLLRCIFFCKAEAILDRCACVFLYMPEYRTSIVTAMQ